jgi:serine/threonine-protein kinase
MAKTCPICETSYPDSMAFCPNDGATLRSEEKSQDLVGAIIADRYRVNKLLGEGGMGRVYLAEHVRLPQQAAIKVLHPGMVQEPGAVARFNREAANAARIEHDRVARVFDFGETADGIVYLAMEFVPGRTLRDVLAESGRLPPARAANIIHQVSEGLQAAHRIGIIHRDLKADNILVVTDENGVDRTKVVDFGIAKVVDNSQEKLTQTGMLVGTPEFMSPEQVLGETLDARSDVYSLALVGYQLFTGALPFGNTTPERSLAIRLMEDAKPLSDAAPDVQWPDALQAAFDRALARDVAERTASAIEFGEAVVSAVEEWVGASILRGRTPLSSPSLVGTAASMTPASATPSVTVAQSTAVGTAKSADLAPAAVVTAPKKNRMPMIGAGVLGIAAVAVFAVMKMGSGAASAAQDSPPSVSPDSANALGVQTPAQTPANSGNTARPRDASTQGTAANAPATNPAPATVTTQDAAAIALAIADSIQYARDLAKLERLYRDVGGDSDNAARAAIPQLVELLPRLRAPIDSFRVYKSLFEARMITTDNDLVQSCPALMSASRLARRLGDAERESLEGYKQFGCPSGF